MQMTQIMRRVGPTDVKLMRRDHFLVFMFSFIIVIAVALRFGLPWLNEYLAVNALLPSATINQSLADYYPLLIVFMAVYQGAMIAGIIFGFALLDEKDDNTLKAMLVTPIPPQSYVLYRVIVPTICAFPIVLAMILFIDQALISFWQLTLIALGASLLSPIAALFFAIFAENKVQGFAMAKIVSITGWIILGSWFVAEPWQWLFGLYPPFWISKAYWMAYDSNPWWWVALIVGIILQIGLIKLLMVRFSQVVYR